MQARDHHTEARRWAKFPATILLATGLLWLLQSYFELDWLRIGQQSETGVGALLVFTSLVIIPLGSVAAGLGLLFTQRWAMYAAFVLPVITLAFISAHKLEQIGIKFAEFRQDSARVDSFGGGVMTALLLVALWAVYGVIVAYLLKSLRQLDLAYAYTHRRGDRGRPAVVLSGAGAVAHEATGGDDELCLYMPESDDSEE